MKFIYKLRYLIVFIISLIFFYLIIHRQIPTDIQAHIIFIQKLLEFKIFPPNFLYYLIIYVVSFFSSNFKMLALSSVIVLSISVVFKFKTSEIIFESINDFKAKSLSNVHLFILLIVLMSLLFVHPIYLLRRVMGDPFLFVGMVPMNVWHNSTTIFLFPFAIILFYYSYKFLETKENKYLYLTFLFSVINILLKPSFFFCLAVIFPLFALLKFRFKKEFWYSCIVIAGAAIILAIQFYLIYANRYLDKLNFNEGTSKVILAPFSFWSVYSKHIALDLVMSVLFPIFFIILYFNKIKNSLLLQYSGALFILGLLILILFAESGIRFGHGNFRWQAIVTNYIFFLSTVILFYKILKEGNFKIGNKGWFMIAVYFIHFLCGLGYVIKMIIQKSAY